MSTPRLIIHCDGGLANRLNCLNNGLLIAGLLDLSYQISWPVNRYCGAALTDLLDNCDFVIDKRKDEYPRGSNIGLIASDNFLCVNPGYLVDPGIHILRSSFVRKIHHLITSCELTILFYPLPLPQFYFDCWHSLGKLPIKISIRHAASQELLRLGLKPFRYWGVHLRGTDSRRSNQYYSFFRSLLVFLPGYSLLLSDDQSILEIFSHQRRVKNRHGIPLVDKYNSNLEWSALAIDENSQFLPYNVNRSAESVREALIDLLLLSGSLPLPTSTSSFLEMSILLNPLYGRLLGFLFYARSVLGVVRVNLARFLTVEKL